MKTLHKTLNHNDAISQPRVRLALTFVGIVIAVLCSIVLRYDGPSAPRTDAGTFHFLKFFNAVATDIVGEVIPGHHRASHEIAHSMLSYMQP
jgi:hypothetical protein